MCASKKVFKGTLTNDRLPRQSYEFIICRLAIYVPMSILLQQIQCRDNLMACEHNGDGK